MKTTRLMALAALLLMLGSTGANGAPAPSFSDVAGDDWFHGEVAYLADLGIVHGYEDGSFRPYDQVGVDAFIKMLVVSLGTDPGNGTGYWASTYIGEARELGLLEPAWFDAYDRPVTREEMALLAAGAIGYLEDLVPYAQYAYHLEDYTAIREQSREAVLINVSKGIINGFEDYTFRPGRTATRAEAAAIISRVMDPARRRQMNYFDAAQARLLDLDRTLRSREAEAYKPLGQAMTAFLGRRAGMASPDDYSWQRRELEQRLFNILQAIALETDDGWQESRSGGTVYYSRHEDPLGATIAVEEDTITYSMKDPGSGWRHAYETDPTGSYSVLQTVDAAGSGVRISSATTASGTDYQLQQLVGGKDGGLSVDYYADHDYYYDAAAMAAMHVEESYMQVQAYENVAGDGVCYILLPDGASYVGRLSSYRYVGSGRLSYADGTRFIGRFDNLSLNGGGVLVYPNGTVLEGEFEDTFAVSRDARITGPGGVLGDFDRLLEDILADTVKDFMNTSARIKALHDYLVLNVEYAADTIQNELSDLNYNNPYAALVEGRSVCLGYAQTLNLLLNRIGIESYVVIGDADKDGQDDHAWNYVAFEDGFYHVDATWDDPDAGNRVDSRFFKVSDAQMRTQRNITAIIGR